MPLVAQILSLIPQQNFELIRARIVAILKCELQNQYAYHNDPALRPSDVCDERFTPIDGGMSENGGEFPLIIVCLGSGKYDNKDYGGNVTGTYYYYVDIYTGSASTSAEGGDKLATLALERIMGMCRYIMDNPIYCTLGFDPQDTDGMQIQNVSVETFHIDPDRKPLLNADDCIWGAMKISVTVPETTKLLDTIPVSLATVTVTVNDTDKGYKWGPIDESA